MASVAEIFRPHDATKWTKNKRDRMEGRRVIEAQLQEMDDERQAELEEFEAMCLEIEREGI